MNDIICNKVIVFGSNHHNTLGVVRALGEKGINPYVLISNNKLTKSFVLKSKYVVKGWIIKSDKLCLQHILENFVDKEHKAIIICATDSAASCVDLNYDRLVIDFIIPNGGKQGLLTHLMNKNNMNNLAKDVGFNISKTWLIEGNTIERNSIIEEIEYPCITKPISSIEGSKAEIRICQNVNDLKLFLLNRSNKANIQVQKYIDKDFEYQLIGCSLNGGENIVIPGFTNIIRASSVTNTGFLSYSPIVNLKFDKAKCVEYIRRCNFSGLFSLEFIRGKDGEDYFLEINFRNDGNAYAVTAAGINLPYIWVASCLNIDFIEETRKEIRSIKVMPELVDIFQVFSGCITLRKWLMDLIDTNSFLYFNKSDKGPFNFELYRLLISIFKRIPQKIIKKLRK